MPLPEITRLYRRTFRALLSLTLWLVAHGSGAATFTVINTNDSGVGSFRAAISNANLTLGSNFITFAITTGGKTIKPTSPFQLVSNTLTIDATTQTGYAGTPLVELNGTNAGGAGYSGIFIIGSNCTVRGLCINRFSGDGIRLEGAGSNVVQANFLGTDLTGTNAAPNGWGNLGQGGVSLLSPFNLIGGTSATNRNVISGNSDSGVLLINTGTGGNLVQGNFIGCDASGTKRVPNLTNGIILKNSSSNLIGGTITGARNLISGNGGLGMNFFQFCNGNLVQGNFIGVNAAGSGALSNGAAGVLLFDVSDGPKYNLIGGTNAGARNVISGNGTDGVVINGTTVRNNQIAGNYIGTSSSGLAKIPNGGAGVNLTTTVSNLVGGAMANAGNVISGNGFSGVLIGPLSLVVGNVVQNNFIGTDANGTNALANGSYGVNIIKAAANTIGPGNIISGNTQSGLLITSNANNNRIVGNFIGTDASGTRSLGNVQFGLLLEAPANTIGGANTSDRNLISGNTNSGVFFNGAVASNNLVLGNFIGTDVTGALALKNFAQGIRIDNAPGNTIGSSAARNIISGNGLSGILIQSNLAAANVIQGNYLGTDLNGAISLPNGTTLLTYTNASGNPTNNPGGGIDITAASSTVIGGANPGEGNLISANWRDAISIGDTGASNTVIQGNLIGVTANLAALGNEWNGVELRTDGGCVGTVIANNVLANARLSQRSGVRVRNLVNGVVANTNVLISGNSIYHNGGVGSYTGLGIALDGKAAPLAASTNDSCDGDTGANLLQNYPVLTTAYADGQQLYVAGTFNSASRQTFTLEFFTNALDPSTTFYQGQYFAGSTNVTTTSCAAGSFALVIPVPARPGQRITATAFDANNNTSEFSPPVAVTATPTLTTSVSATNLAQLKLAWPTNLTGFALQQTTNLLPVIVWNSVTNSAVVLGTNYSVNVTRTNGQRFFRLAFP